MANDLSIIIPTYNRHTVLERALGSVAQHRPPSSEVIIVDQSPNAKEKSALFLKQYPFIRYICIRKIGLPYARNVGIQNSTCGILLFIDDDTLVHPNCFIEHLKSHSQNGISVIAGRITQMNKNVSWAQTSTVATIDSETGETTGNFDIDYDGTIPYATGGHLSIKREVFQHAGLFNPKFIGNALFEDVEFSFRIRKKGYPIHYNAQAIVYHYPIDNGGCHESDTTEYLIERLHNHLLFYILHLKKIPSKSFSVYIKNLVEYISRTRNERHSIIRISRCMRAVCRAYINALISFYFNPKLR